MYDKKKFDVVAVIIAIMSAAWKSQRALQIIHGNAQLNADYNSEHDIMGAR